MRYRVNPADEPLGGAHDWDHLKVAGARPVYRDALFGGDDAPSPDPAIGQAALMNAELAKEMAGVARDQLAWNKEQYAELAPTLKKILDQQVALGNVSQERAQQQWQHYQDVFLPIEQKMAQEAMAEGSPAQQEAEANRARADVAKSFEAQRGVTSREIGRMGINPNSGRFANLLKEGGNAQAAAEAGGMNTARNNARMRGIALRSGAAQFGRNMPQTGIASDSLSLNAGRSAASVGTGSLAAANAGANSAVPWYGGAQAGNASAGNLLLGQFQGQLAAHGAEQSAQAALLGGMGSAAGYFFGGAQKPWVMAAKGGVVRPNRMARKGYARGGIVSTNPMGFSLGGVISEKYADGGIVEGPGTSTSDSIPAVIDGQQPAALSNGEGVLNKAAVDLVGEEFVHRINRGALRLKAVQKGVRHAA